MRGFQDSAEGFDATDLIDGAQVLESTCGKLRGITVGSLDPRSLNFLSLYESQAARRPLKASLSLEP